MAKKKKSQKQKKHQFKYAQPREAESARPTIVGPVASHLTPTIRPVLEVANIDLIKTDIRQVALLASGFIILELLLWFLFEHTGLGSAVYHLIKV